MPYDTAVAVQRRVHSAVLAGQQPQALVLVEHEPVITISQRRGASKHLRVSRGELARRGIDAQPTDRGGGVTYHGPGQLVAYPILRLGALGLNVGRYMRLLEQAVIDTVAAFGIRAYRDPGRTGVWVNPTAQHAATGGRIDPYEEPRASLDGRPAKLCAMGIRVRRNVTLHGLALNVTTDLAGFEVIVPCGLTDCSVTSMWQLLGHHTPAMEQVKDQLVASMRGRLAACIASHQAAVAP